MKKKIHTINDFDIENKRILVRIDINVPMDLNGNILDDIRIKNYVPTLESLKNAKIVLLAHQSRPGKCDFTTMKSHAERITKYIGRKVQYIDDIFGSHAIKKIQSMKKGDVLLLENVRFYSEESLKRSGKEHANTHMVQSLAPLFDLYLNDAFAVSHRSQLSILGFPEVIPCGMGKLMEREIIALDKGMSGKEHPCIFVIGGIKIDDSLNVVENVLMNGYADKILFTGVVGNVVLKAAGFEIGTVNLDFIKSQGYIKEIERAKTIIDRFEDKIEMPIDVALNDNGARIDVDLSTIKKDCLPINDIGIETIVSFSNEIKKSKTVILNGPAGVFELEPFSLGTHEIIKAATHSEFSIVGGGHISAEVRRMNFEDKFFHISTGGGACISYLAGEKLVGIESLRRDTNI